MTQVMHRRTFFSALAAAAPLLGQEEYKQGPDSFRQEGVPKGVITAHKWTSKLFPGTIRDYWVYVPSQLAAGTPAPVMIFQDGGGMIREDGAGYKVPVVLDNLIHKKDVPPLIAIFINPGILPAANASAQPRFNRSLEYDGLGDLYARFLIEEILPEVAKAHTLSKDPDHYALAGSSSGGIAAFNAAWSRPDQFRRVLSFIGSFVNLRGAQILPSLIRKFEPKPLRVFLQDGSNDNDIYGGSWWIANQDMARSLEWSGYESKFVKGTEAHNSKHGSAILPDALRWLWKDFPKPIARPINTSDRHYLNTALIAGKDWELVGSGYRFTEGPAVDKSGQVFFTDIPNNRIHKIALDGSVSVFAEDTGAANGLMFHADGQLYAVANARQQLVRYDAEGRSHIVATNLPGNDLVTTFKDGIYSTDPDNKKIWYTAPSGDRRLVDIEHLELVHSGLAELLHRRAVVRDAHAELLRDVAVAL
mgnify:CR=1 FL=1